MYATPRADDGTPLAHYTVVMHFVRSARLKLIGFVLVYFACAAPSHASTFILMSESDLATRSIAAVTGNVTAIEAAADPATGGVNTYVHIAPADVVFGSLPGGPLVLREPGGRLRDRSEWIYGSPEYRIGEEVLVFLSQNSDGTLRTTSMSMGKFTIESDDRGTLNALRDLGEGAALWDMEQGELITDPAPESYDFKDLVDTVRRARSVQEFTRHPRVQMVPPELARAALREQQSSFTYLASPSRWFEPDSGEAIPFLIDAAGDSGVGGVGGATSRAAINDAFAAWSNVASSDLMLSDAGTTTDAITFAGCLGGNRIMFNDRFNEITDPVGCGGVLAIGGFCASGETKIVNGTSFRRIRVGKITFNNGWSQCPGWNRCNMSEVATHELGHTLGFGHSTDFNATMYASAHFDGRCAALRADDLAAINFVYPSMVLATPSPSKTPVPPTSTATVARSATPTLTRTFSPTVPSATATASRSATPSRSVTRTNTVPPTGTATPILTATAPAPPTSTPTLMPRRRVRGHVQYYSSARAVPNVTMSLRGATQNAALTSDAGMYEFDGVPPGTWELVAEKASDFGEGVSPLDAAFVLQTVANLRRLDASQRLACDVTGDGQLTALDAARILQFSVGTLGRLPVGDTCGSDWSFVPDPAPMQQRSVTDPRIDGGACSDGKITLEGLADEIPDQDFRAILFGDCTGNWDNAASAALGRAGMARTSRVRLGKPAIDGARVLLPVYVRAPAPYNALDLEVAYDSQRLTPAGVRLGRGSSSGLTSFHAPRAGSLRVAMASSEPIKRRFGILLQLEFTLADGMNDPGDVRALTAKVDELPANIAGAAPVVRR